MKNKKSYMLIGFLIICLVEIVLRLIWINPYLERKKILTKEPSWITLHIPYDFILNVKGLYKEGSYVKFRIVLPRRFIHSPCKFQKGEIAFFGGSTTECQYVDEGKRYPDITGKNLMLTPINWGISGTNIFNSYLNLKFLLEEGLLGSPKIVVLMHGVNDLATLTRTGNPDIISNISYLTQYFKKGDYPNGLIQNFKDLVKHIYSISFPFFYVMHYFKYYLVKKSISVVSFYEAEVKKQESIIPISEEEFKKFLNSELLKKFLKNRENNYLKFINFCKSKNIQVVLLTQPHSYRENYKTFNKDLRLYFKIKNKLTNLSQSRKLMDLINQHTRKIAEKYKIPLIDVDEYFKNMDVSQLFYDSHHFTPPGCKVIGNYVANQIRNKDIIY